MRGRSRSYGRRPDRGSRDFDDWYDLESPSIWIGGCPDDISKGEVAHVCSKFGVVRDISIRNTHHETYALVRFGRLSHARYAINALDQTAAFGKQPVTVEPAGRGREAGYRARARKPGRGRRGDYESRERRGGNGGSGGYGYARRVRRRSSRSRRSREPSSPQQSAAADRPVRIYLSQLPRDMEEDEFQEIVGEYGNILHYELHREGAYKCGWVEYGNKSEAEAALLELDDRRMDEWNMRLQAYMYPGGGP